MSFPPCLVLYLTADNWTLFSPNRHSGTASSSRFCCRGAAFSCPCAVAHSPKHWRAVKQSAGSAAASPSLFEGTETVSTVTTATVQLSSQTSGQRREMSEICRRFIRRRERGATWLVAEKDVWGLEGFSLLPPSSRRLRINARDKELGFYTEIICLRSTSLFSSEPFLSELSLCSDLGSRQAFYPPYRLFGLTGMIT